MDKVPVELAALIAKGWQSDEFKKRLKTNRKEAFERFGLKHEDYPNFDLPSRPDGLKMEKLNRINYAEMMDPACTNSITILTEHVIVDNINHTGDTILYQRPKDRSGVIQPFIVHYVV